jgi:UDP-N-acetylglucosamine/UDP-N-acetylgalactosamine diphosphorylase
VVGAAARTSSFEGLRARYAALGQEHVFRHWPRLDARSRERLRAQAEAIDLEQLLPAFASALARAREGAGGELEPPVAERIPAHGGDPERFRQAAARGAELLAAGRVAALVVAGGQGTRLGFEGPKGCFPLGPVTGRSLFEQQAQKIRALRRRYGRPLPWYVMTSDATDAATRAFLERHARFGLPEGDVFVFRQGMVPSFDFAGRLILEAPGRIFESPNGHGGVLTALVESGALDDMEGRGVDTIFYYQVDNPLVRLGDPAFLGFHAAAGAEMSVKVVKKREPGEKMGVLARRDGRLGVVEYTELEDRHRHARDASGELVFWAGNLAIHAFATAFVRRVAARAHELLPLHASAKKIPSVDDEGRPVVPAEPNGHKLERFVFDALPAARAVSVVETSREEEYAPVKNAEGGESPETSRRALCALYRRWLAAADVEAPAEGVALEIDHSRVDGPDDARGLGIRSFREAPDVIRTAAGAEA